MCAVTMREYRSTSCTGSMPVSATGNAYRSTFGSGSCAWAKAGKASGEAASAFNADRLDVEWIAVA
jgi:hypothetical protein